MGAPFGNFPLLTYVLSIRALASLAHSTVFSASGVMSRIASVLSFVCLLLAISTNCIHYNETLSFDVFKNCKCTPVNDGYFDVNCTARLPKLGGSLPPNWAFPANMLSLYAFYIRVQCFLHEFVSIQ